jgi:LPXTG-site transpeptidase (sortase) family protein
MKRLFIGLAVVVALATACGQSPQPSAHAHALPKPSATPVDAPVRLQVARIGIDAPVEQVGVDASDNMDVPKLLSDVAWYKGATNEVPGVLPGRPGDAVIAGHKDSVNGQHGVFWTLTSVQVGDELVVVLQSGTRLRFKVTDTESVTASSNTKNLGLFATSGAPRLTLITCTGQVNTSRTAYLDRLIVNATYQGKA